MTFRTHGIPLAILGVTAILSSRIPFLVFDDPEGTNLLVSTAAAAIIYLISVAPYAFGLQASDTKTFLLAILMQAITVAGMCFLGLR